MSSTPTQSASVPPGTIHLVEPVRNLVLMVDGKKVVVNEGRLDYYGSTVTVRPKEPTRDLIVLSVPPADQGKRVFGRRGSLRVIGEGAGTMTWTQVCSCNAAALKKELLALEPVAL